MIDSLEKAVAVPGFYSKKQKRGIYAIMDNDIWNSRLS